MFGNFTTSRVHVLNLNFNVFGNFTTSRVHVLNLNFNPAYLNLGLQAPIQSFYTICAVTHPRSNCYVLIPRVSESKLPVYWEFPSSKVGLSKIFMHFNIRIRIAKLAYKKYSWISI